ncbi:glycosyltransferase family 2 protein [Opitutus sp. GAS368]|uniref:glycosyltransferase family 2 protein n=1 Tax=Opitutus sp. GAS368 TaxID=1882749 RepID=UPI00087B9E77|nr:glycosyltransferase family 2 protein [Opitutus sp. GAS368]SDS63871.1 Glycosyl transferase family 2 [Opitutus sp. GAS368]
MNPLITVVIPCYNAAPWMAGTIASVRAQTWRRYEIILVNDGSKDGSGEIADRLAGPDLQVVHQANAGQCAAFNRGLALAQGDYIEYLDADDLLAADKLQIQIERLQQLPPGWIASGAWGRFAENPAETKFEPEAVWRDLSPVEWLVTSWQGGGMMHGAAWLVPRSVAQAAGLWDERLSLINDFDYFSRVLLASQGIAFCARARTYYRSGLAGSLSASTSRRAWDSAFLSTELGTKSLLAREDSPRTRAAAAINWQRLIYSAYPFVPDLVRKGEAEVRRLGGCELEIGGGPVFQVLRRVLGWKPARRAQVFGRRLFKR